MAGRNLYMGPYVDGSDNDDDEFVAKQGRQRGRLSNGRIDFNKLELVSLQRYRKAYKLPEQHPANRDALLDSIVQHFAILCVDEDETLIRFAMACRRNGQRLGLGVKKRPGSARPRGR